MKPGPAVRWLGWLAALGLAALGLAAALPGAEADALAASFRSPPAAARPQTWWHWMNGNVSREGITLDLEAMQRAGLSGAQLFQIGADLTPLGPVPYGTPENLELVRFAIQEADRLGLELTLHNCPGWSSSGGPWITPELAMKNLGSSETRVEGGRHVSLDLPKPWTERPEFTNLQVVAFPATDSAATPIDPVAMVDLTDRVDARGHLEWDAPAGSWTVLRIGVTVRDRLNRYPAQGGEGLECDKFSREAMDFHFAHFFGPMLEALGPLARQGRAGALIDSYEVGKQDWSEKLPEEFRRRTGYDLRPWLPAMAKRIVRGEAETRRFLWDLRRVQAELVQENYFGRFAELCRQHGLKVWLEPYGSGNFDELAVGALADVPMGEFWQDRSPASGRRSVKLAATAAHLTGRSVVAAESFTSMGSRWLEFPHALKAMGDAMFAHGLTQVVLHRYAMQPHPAAVPGMAMGPYGGHFDRTNPWFEPGRAWFDYLARAQFLLRQGEFVGDLLYFIGEDSPARVPDRDQLFPAVPAGYDYDTVDRSTLLGMAQVTGGRVRFGAGSSYGVLVVPPLRAISPEVLRRLRDLARDGLTVVVTGDAPRAAPGLAGYPASDAEVSQLAAELWGELDGRLPGERAVGSGRIVRGRPLAEVLAGLGLAPDFEAIGYPGAVALNTIHRRSADADIYFVANAENRPIYATATFNVTGRTPELWDAVTGQTMALPFWSATDDRRTKVALQLPAAGSAFLVFRAAAKGEGWQSVKRGNSVFDGLAARRLRPAQPVAAAPANEDADFPLPAMPAAEAPAEIEYGAAAAGAVLAWENGDYTLSRRDGSERRVAIASLTPAQALVGPWQLAFPAGGGAPASLQLDRLISLSLSPIEGVRHFSGTVTYRHRFTGPATTPAPDRRVYLDLGRVQVLAEVRLNGKELGTLWTAPFRPDVTNLLRAGENELEIRVTNLLANRLIGDELLPAENSYEPAGDRKGRIKSLPAWYRAGQPKPPGGRLTFETWKHFDATDVLPASGLLGPVVLREAAVLDAGSTLP